MVGDVGAVPSSAGTIAGAAARRPRVKIQSILPSGRVGSPGCGRSVGCPEHCTRASRSRGRAIPGTAARGASTSSSRMGSAANSARRNPRRDPRVRSTVEVLKSPPISSGASASYFIDHVEEMGQPAPLRWAGLELLSMMHRDERDPPAGNLDLRADRHAAADSLLAARRPEPAAIGIEADHEGTVEAEGAGYGIAVESRACSARSPRWNDLLPSPRPSSTNSTP